jgi:hypothetical protein
MEKKSSFNVKRLLKQKGLAVILFFCSLSLLTACNNQPKDKTTDTGQKADSTTKKKDSLTTNATASSTDKNAQPFKVHTYQLTVDQQKYLFQNDDVKEIELKFKLIAANDYTLEAVATDGDGNESGNPVILKVVDNTATTFPKMSLRRLQRLTRGDFKVIYKLFSEINHRRKIDPKFFQDLLFIPSTELDDDNSVFFYVTLPNKAGGQVATQPSPPASACGKNCDH